MDVLWILPLRHPKDFTLGISFCSRGFPHSLWNPAYGNPAGSADSPQHMEILPESFRQVLQILSADGKTATGNLMALLYEF